MDMKKVFDYIETLRPEMLDTLGELVSCPSFRSEPEEGAPFGPAARKCLDKALEICGGLGFKTNNVGGYAGTASFTDGESVLGILAHLDIVPAGDGWTREPYQTTVEDGLVYGRGTMDDKGPAVSVIYAMKALKDLGVPLKSGFELILGTDEECGSSDLRYFMEHEKMPKWLFTPDASYPLINIEKGRIAAHFSASAESESLISLHGGKTVNAVPASAGCELRRSEKISARALNSAISTLGISAKFSVSENEELIKISVEGVSAHASTPDFGDNALTALIKLLAAVIPDDPAGKLLCGLNITFPYRETDGESAGVKACDEISGALTLAFSILDYENGRFDGAADIRFPVCESVGSLSEKLGAALRKIGFEPDIGGVEPHCVPSDSPFVGKLLDAYETVTHKKGECLAIGGGTYVHGIPGGVAFGCEVEGIDNRIHGADEFIGIDALIENAKIFAQAIVNVCG